MAKKSSEPEPIEIRTDGILPVEIVKEIGAHPRTGKLLTLYKSKQGLFLKKGMRRIYLPSSVVAESLTPEAASEYLK